MLKTKVDRFLKERITRNELHPQKEETPAHADRNTHQQGSTAAF